MNKFTLLGTAGKNRNLLSEQILTPVFFVGNFDIAHEPISLNAFLYYIPESILKKE